MKKLVVLFSLMTFANGLFAQAHILFLMPLDRQEKTIELSNNVKLNYVEQGNRLGVPVIFLHGYTDSWHSFDYVLNHLPKKYHAFAISLRGHGNSDRTLTGYQPEGLAADVASFVKQLNLGPVIIVGHSMGGVIAQRFVLDYPLLAKSMVIVSSAANFTDNEPVKEFNSIVQKFDQPVDSAFAAEFQSSTIVHPISSKYFNTVVNESRKVPVHVWKSALAELIKANYTNELSKINIPTLIVWGEKDSFCQRKEQDELLKSIRGAKLLIYPGTGHALHWEQPERFVKDLENFIDK
ncbi:MAG: alpha/beta hydrolase [Chitinophagaceae bacterium]|nr:alpha/beta hydrolase [Chitinophagaceae bacterium]